MGVITIQPGQAVPVYECRPVVFRTPAEMGEGDIRHIDWERYEAAALTDTVTGLTVREATEVRACWSSEWVYVLFTCRDAHVVSNFQHRDDPLYEQDVVELFIDEVKAGTEYIELEVSPHNVVFDARIWNDGHRSITASDVSWDMEGLETAVKHDADGGWTCEIRIPTHHFLALPCSGRSWNVNFYRIDEDPQGSREFQAWSPTGEVNYHIPSRFGKLVFVD
ncbi:hypothetical protein JCM10914A_23480 [Paenibacillus sp. JCM 10914]